ncbi:PREDICTED: sideroflexin-4 [Chrysochloris asiatica]|uniref:Sideroflexin-4 n=1 Tax=Chrysochloris asiatica TaxID=185453 RepID=A0A9B0WGP8_CHRAS|nr:PREDICTED: sideroflexin-4 [Chrysochloris asiatica]
MEPNVRFWISERQSFVQRFLLWTELLDPTNLVISIEKVEKLRQLLTDEAGENVEDKKIQEAWKRSLSTVHPDGSTLIPAPFRPAAFLPLMGPMVFFSMMPSKGIKSMILPQFSLYTYLTPFNIINGNTTYPHHLGENLLLGTGVIASSTFFGIIPQLVQIKYSLDSHLVRFMASRVLPVIFLAQVSGMNVLASRSLESTRGITVMDKEGKVIGHSRRAGQKAVQETAVSRVVLFGTSAGVSEVLAYCFRRTQFFLQHPWSLWTVKLSCSILAMGLMVPVSFSMFPLVGQIPRSKLEEEIQSSTEETELFYYRGV